VFCWLVIALIRDPGKGTIKGLGAYLPLKLPYWTTLRMVRSSQWDAAAVMTQIATTTLWMLPPPADGVLYLIGDSTLKAKRGRKHPLGRTTRHSEHDPYTFGFEMVLLITSWDRFRVPIALALIDPQCRGHQNTLFRQMLQDFVPPSWVAPCRGHCRCGLCYQCDHTSDNRPELWVCLCDAPDPEVYQW